MLLDFPGDTTTVVCVELTLTEEIVEDEEVVLVEVADVVGKLVGTPSGGKYSPGTNS
jgi:hypothetical protein